MARIEIAFVTRVARSGYEVRGERIVRKGLKTDEREPLRAHADLYREFANLADDPQSLADFMGKFGPLTHDGANEQGEWVERLINLRRWLHRSIELAANDQQALMRLPSMSPQRQEAASRLMMESVERLNAETRAATPERLRGSLVSSDDLVGPRPRAESAAAMLTATLRPGAPDGRPTLCMTPDTLADALKLQFYQKIASGTGIRSCKWCGNWFEIGPSGKSSQAQFCSSNCRVYHHLKSKGEKK